MFGLRQKLLLGFGGLLVILLMVSGLGIAVSMQHRSALSQFLYENWRSIEYGQNMIEAIDRLSEIADHVAALPAPDQADLNKARTAAADTLKAFDQNLEDENHNITLPGEDKLADNLSVLWNGRGLNGKSTADSYQIWFTKLLASETSAADRVSAYSALHRLAPQVRLAAKAIVKLNFDNMTPIEGQIKTMADRAIRLLFVLSGIGVALAIIVTAVMGRSILQPVQALTRSAREIEQGNLDLVVQVQSHDELHQLAEAFNSMTSKLREYRRTNRAKLVRTQQTTQLAINSLPDAVAILSPDGVVEMANKSAQKLFLMAPDAHVTSLGSPWLQDLYARTRRDLSAVEPRGYESAIQVLDEKGGERFFLPHAVPILDEDQQLLGVTVVLADVTHLRRLDEMKSSMLAVVSHELKTPLMSIRMGVHLLLEECVGPLTSKQNDLLVAMRDDSGRLGQIVENLLDMGRIESGRALMEFHPEMPDRLIAEATEQMSAAYHEKGVELAVEAAEDLPKVSADRDRVQLIFSNLLSNALRFTPPGGMVRVSADREGEFVRFSVTDMGPGIAPEYQERIFERFFRVPGQPKGSGAGLGLAIAREVVQAHGGTIRVEAADGQGSRFRFTLPIVATPSPQSTGTNGEKDNHSAPRQEALTPT